MTSPQRIARVQLSYQQMFARVIARDATARATARATERATERATVNYADPPAVQRMLNFNIDGQPATATRSLDFGTG
jgi:hypothetical protein